MIMKLKPAPVWALRLSKSRISICYLESVAQKATIKYNYSSKNKTQLVIYSTQSVFYSIIKECLMMILNLDGATWLLSMSTAL